MFIWIIKANSLDDHEAGSTTQGIVLVVKKNVAYRLEYLHMGAGAREQKLQVCIFSGQELWKYLG